VVSARSGIEPFQRTQKHGPLRKGSGYETVRVLRLGFPYPTHVLRRYNVNAGSSGPYSQYSAMRKIQGIGELRTTAASNDLCQTLLHLEQTHPQDSLFRDDLFNATCQKIRNRNETMVIRDIGLLIVPSAQTLATYGALYLNHLIESVNEGWKSAIAFYGPCPQPDYSVGFGRSAFTEDRLKKLKPLVSEVLDSYTLYFMAIW